MDDTDPDDQTTESGAPAARSSNFLVVAWQRRSLVLLFLVVGVALGGLNHLRRPAVYQASAQVLVVKKKSEALPVAGGDPRLAVYEDYVSTHLILIKSPIVVQRAVDKRNLGQLPSFAHGDPAGAIRAGLIASRDKDTPGQANNIINLTFQCGAPADAEAVLRAVIESYHDFLDETYKTVSDTALQQINRAGNLLKDDLAEKEKKYREFRQTSPLLTRGADGVNVHLQRIAELQKKETGLLERGGELRERVKAVEAARANGESAAQLLALATRPFEKQAQEASARRALEEHLFPLLLREKELLQDYGEDHPQVVRVREQIAMTRDFHRRLGSAGKEDPDGDAAARVDWLLQNLKQELALTDTARAALAGLIDEEVAKARALEVYEIQDESFRKDIGLTQQLLDQILKRLEEVNLVRDYGGFEAKVIAPPTPGAKISPVLYHSLLLGVAVGLALGFGAAYLLDLTDRSFRTPEEVRRRLGLPIVGHIPFFPSGGKAVVVTDPAGRPVELDAGLYAVHRPTSVEAETFRSVRTALYFSTHGERHKVIQVTSPSQGDGKTTVIANLAVAIAQTGRKVVLVDADLRRPRIHRAFGVRGRVGMTDLLTGDAGPADAIYPTVVPNLSVLPCGRRPPNPAELLTSPRLGEVLDDLREAYDYVLVDTPPLLAVSDPCAVAPRVDGVLLTLRVSKNGRPAAEQAHRLLAGLKVQILGVVVNGIGKDGKIRGYAYEHYRYDSPYADGYASDDPDPALGPDAPPAPALNGKAPHAPVG
jgi:capsular exopolysaccharide synthesis family protein